MKLKLIPMRHQRDEISGFIPYIKMVTVREKPKTIQDPSLPESRISKMHFVNFKRALKNERLYAYLMRENDKSTCK